MENNPIFISFLQNIHLVGPYVEIPYDEVNKQLQLYKSLYNVRFIYPEHRASSESGHPKIYSHLINIVSKEYYYDVYSHKSNEIPITTCSSGSCTYGFAKGKPFVTGTISCWRIICEFSMKIHYPIDGTYKNVSFFDPALYQNTSIIKPMMLTNKGFDAQKKSKEDERK